MFKKIITTYLKAKKFVHATHIASFKYIFIVFFEKTDAKIYIIELESKQLIISIFSVHKVVFLNQ